MWRSPAPPAVSDKLQPRRPQPRPDPQRTSLAHRVPRDLTPLAGVDLSHPLFNGGGQEFRKGGEDFRVRSGAGRIFRAVEGSANSAYNDVIRDRAIVELNAEQREGARELPRSDPGPNFPNRRPHPHHVAESEARLQLGRSQLSIAQGQENRERSNLSPGDRPSAGRCSPRRHRCRRFPATPTRRSRSRSPTTRTWSR